MGKIRISWESWPWNFHFPYIPQNSLNPSLIPSSCWAHWCYHIMIFTESYPSPLILSYLPSHTERHTLNCISNSQWIRLCTSPSITRQAMNSVLSYQQVVLVIPRGQYSTGTSSERLISRSSGLPAVLPPLTGSPFSILAPGLLAWKYSFQGVVL